MVNFRMIDFANLQFHNKSLFYGQNSSPVTNKPAVNNNVALLQEDTGKELTDTVSLNNQQQEYPTYSSSGTMENRTVSGSLHMEFFVKSSSRVSYTGVSENGFTAYSIQRTQEYSVSLDFNFLMEYKTELAPGDVESFNQFLNSGEFFDLASAAQSIILEGRDALEGFNSAVDNYFDALEEDFDIPREILDNARNIFKSEVETFVDNYERINASQSLGFEYNKPTIGIIGPEFNEKAFNEMLEDAEDKYEVLLSDVKKLMENVAEKLDELSEQDARFKPLEKALSKIMEHAFEKFGNKHEKHHEHKDKNDSQHNN